MMTLQFPTGRPKLLRRRSPARCLCAYQPKTITHRSEDAASPTRNLLCLPAVASRDLEPARATPSQAPDPYLSQCLEVRGYGWPTRWGQTRDKQLHVGCVELQRLGLHAILVLLQL